MTSVNTNTGAMTALMSLNATSSSLASTEKKISTGYKVADATDDGAAYAVAQGVRSNVSVLTAVNNQLGNATGLMSVTNSALSSASTYMQTISSDLTNIAAGTSNETANYVAKFTTDLKQLNNYLTGANYNGQSLINTTGTTAAATAATQTLTMDDQGTTQAIGNYDVSSLITNLTALSTSFTGATSADQATAASTYVKGNANGGTPATAGLQVDIAKLNSVASQAGSDSNTISNQSTYNSSKMDALNTGLGALVDADLAKESANLTALQIKQQLGQQSLSISNQAPSGLVSLFR
ncbi:MAG: flagellin [Janthinobacterium lividum]